MSGVGDIQDQQGKWNRPSFAYRVKDGEHWPGAQAQLAESSRNALLAIHREILKTNRLLQRMDRRLARAFPLSKRGRK